MGRRSLSTRGRSCQSKVGGVIFFQKQSSIGNRQPEHRQQEVRPLNIETRDRARSGYESIVDGQTYNPQLSLVVCLKISYSPGLQARSRKQDQEIPAN
jgi:hypothetical protein